MKLKKEISDIIKKYDECLRFHDFRVVKGVTHTNVLFDIEMPLTYSKTPLELKRCHLPKIDVWEDLN